MSLPVACHRRAYLTTLLAATGVAMLAGCVTTDDDGYPTGADRPPCGTACQQPAVIQPRKTVVSATPKVKPKT